MNRNPIVIAIVVLAILILTVWRTCSKSIEKALNSKRSPDSASGQMGPQQIRNQETKEKYETGFKEKLVAFAKQNNASIAFYGRVIDQDSKPLHGVVVDFTVTAIPMIPVLWGPSEITKISCISDQDGLFSIDGKSGTGLSITELKKEGYRKSGYYELGSARFEPNGSQIHMPDRNKPVEFMMIRDDLPKAEKVLDRQLELNWNKAVSIEDFGPDIGKLEFSATRTGRDASNTIKKFEWEVNMRAVGFTMTKLSDGNERMAPLVKYTSNGRVGFSPNEKGWESAPDESYAILTDNGAYGLINLTIYANRDDKGVGGRATIYLNKSGERNIDHK